MHNWHIDAVADHLEAVTYGQIKNLLINIPPGYMKSLMACVFWPCWEWIHFPHLRYLFASYSDELTTRDNQRSAQLLQSEWYQKSFILEKGERTPRGTHLNKFNITTLNQHQIKNDQTGFRIASSVGGVGTGERVDRAINDDLIRVNDAFSDAKRKAALEHMKAMRTRGVAASRFSQILIMQRVHQLDPAAWALERGWDHLCIPLEYDPKRSKVTSLGWKDPRTKEKELLFPARADRTEVEDLKTTLGPYKASAELQQNPTPEGGGLIKTQWFFRSPVTPPLQYRAIIGDTAQKTKEHNDYSVMACFGKMTDGRLIILDLVRKKVEAPDLEQMSRDFWAKHEAVKEQGTLRFMAIEDKSSGTGLIQKVSRDGGIPLLPVERDKDKYTRLLDVQGYLAAGHVGLPENAPWIHDFISECEAFSAEGSHAHDDQVDVLIDGIMLLIVKNSLDLWAKLAG